MLPKNHLRLKKMKKNADQTPKACVNCLYYDKRTCLVFDSEVPPFTSCPQHVFYYKIYDDNLLPKNKIK